MRYMNIKIRLLAAALILTILNCACSDNAEPAAAAATVSAITETHAETTQRRNERSSDFNYRYETSTAYLPTEATEASATEETTTEAETVTTSVESSEEPQATETTTAATAEITTATTAPETTATIETSTVTTTTVTVPDETTEQTTSEPVSSSTPPAATERSETTQTASNEIIRTQAEFFAVLAQASANLESSIVVKLASSDLFNRFTNEEMSELGILSSVMESEQNQGYIQGEISLEYADYHRVSRAYANGTADSLTGTDKAIYQKAVQILQSITEASDNDFEKVLKINNYLTENVKYDYNFGKQSYTAYGALIGGKAVCQGYAYSFQLFMNMLGIESEIVIGTGDNGTGNQNHGWNLINLDGDYYHIDVTWNDTDDADIRRFLYFNITDKIIGSDHTWNRSYYPTANGTKYNYYKYMNLEKTSLAELESAVADGIGNGEKEFEFYCSFPVTEKDLEFVFDYTEDTGFNYLIAPYGNGSAVRIIVG